MFVQVVKGRTKDAAAMRERGEVWIRDVKPGAIGFLGSTVGVTEDGTFVGMARFTDDVAAKANGERPEQDAWWQATAPLVEDATWRETSDVALLFDGGSDAAGFVQVMEGRVADRAKAEAFETEELLGHLRAARPDLLGSVRAWFDDNSYVEFAYFTSEAEARKGEADPEFNISAEQLTAAWGEMTFLDLRDPILTGP